MPKIIVEFEDLPTTIVGGRDYGLGEVRAEISFCRDGNWGVLSIEVNAWGDNGWVYAPLKSSEHPALYAHLIEIIEHRHVNYVESQISDYWDDEREAAADRKDDERRDDRMMGVWP